MSRAWSSGFGRSEAPHVATAACLMLFLTLAPLGAQQGPAALTLKDAVALAQKQGLQAHAATEARDAARARDRSFTGSLLPQLSLTGTLPQYNRSIIPVLQPDGSTIFRAQQQNQSSMTMNVTQQIPYIGGQIFASSALSRLQVVGDRTTQNWSSTPFLVGIRQPVLRSNTAAWDAREQDINADVAERQYVEAREDVAAGAANAFFDFYAAKIALANAQNNALFNDSTFVLNKGRYEVGKIGQNDLLQSELGSLRAQNAVDAARLEYDRTRAALRIQLHLPVGADIDVVVPADIPQFDADTTVAEAQALRNSSGIRVLDLVDVQSRRRISEAKYNAIGATVTASVGFNQTGPVASRVYNDLLQAQQYSVSLQMPLVQWGVRGNQIKAARADQGRAMSTSELTRAQTIQDAHFGALQLAQARRQAQLAAKADTVGAEAFEVARNRYIIGKIGLNDLFTAQSSKDQAVVAYVQALRGYWTAYYRLRRLTLFDFELNQPIR